jgi:hypothetical protein
MKRRASVTTLAITAVYLFIISTSAVDYFRAIDDAKRCISKDGESCAGWLDLAGRNLRTAVLATIFYAIIIAPIIYHERRHTSSLSRQDGS